MKIDIYEKAWIYAGTAIIVVFLGSMLFGAIVEAAQPPSHVETIDPTTARTDPRFANPGVVINSDGSATVIGLAQMFSFMPMEMRVPANRPVTFRLTSPDLIHGFEIVGTNGNAMVVPGYVTSFTTTFKPGSYLIVCNEYCGIGHHVMQGSLIAEDPSVAPEAGARVAPLGDGSTIAMGALMESSHTAMAHSTDAGHEMEAGAGMVTLMEVGR
ncbi:MAG: cytochrome c oxidase subunit II [Gemmatimonadota bacterium]|jgi:cytochrome c oxidase subunit 2|nr:cytochrome c oxidase subunit II [Gemmatimonadota bacterium]